MEKNDFDRLKSSSEKNRIDFVANPVEAKCNGSETSMAHYNATLLDSRDVTITEP